MAGPGDADGRLDGIKDLAGNDLQPNRPTTRRNSRSCCPAPRWISATSPDPLDTFDGKYPTLERHEVLGT